MRRRLSEAAAPSQLRLVIFLEIEAQVIAAVQQAPQAPGRDAEPASRLAAIAAAQLHRRLRGSGGDREQRRGEWNRSVPPHSRRRGRQQLVGRELARGRQEQRSLQGVLELADVPRPGMGPQAGVQVGRERRRGQTMLSGELREQRLRDQEQVVPALPQRRQVEHDGAQPEEEIFPKAAFLHAVRQLVVGGGDNADVHGSRFRAPDPPDLLVLQRAQQLGLEGEREVADLVEEQGAGVRHLEQPRLCRMGVGAQLTGAATAVRKISRSSGSETESLGPRATSCSGMRRPGSVPTTRAGRPGRTLWVSSHCVASCSTPPAATITATVSGDEVTASAGPTTSIAACKSRPRSVQNPWNACDSGITLSRDTATPPRPQSSPRGWPGQSRALMVANLESYCRLSRPQTDPKWCPLRNDSLSAWGVCPWER